MAARRQSARGGKVPAATSAPSPAPSAPPAADEAQAEQAAAEQAAAEQAAAEQAAAEQAAAEKAAAEAKAKQKEPVKHEFTAEYDCYVGDDHFGPGDKLTVDRDAHGRLFAAQVVTAPWPEDGQ